MPYTPDQVREIPMTPGVYLHLDAQGTLLYVGKASNLRNRVRSYFQRVEEKDPKSQALIRRIASTETIQTATEVEALVLENTLIKQHQPRYNVDLKDGKTYPYLQLTWGDAFPRVTFVRRPKRDKRHMYFGPYAGAMALRQVLDVINKHFPIRKCDDRKFNNRTRPCLYWEIGRCSAPCTGEIDEEMHRELVREVVLFLRNDVKELKPILERRMWEYSGELQFEQAARVRDQIQAVERMQQAKAVDIGTDDDVDVWGLVREGEQVMFCLLTVRKGALMGRRTWHVESVDDETDLFSSVLNGFYAEREIPDEVWVSHTPTGADALRERLRELHGKAVEIRRPQRGRKVRALEMALDNAARELAQRTQEDAQRTRILEQLQRRLKLPTLPQRIECYDMSHLMGALAVGCRVVFIDGAPSKTDYRRYKVKGVEEGDDFAMMREVLTRRFSGSGKEEPRPDLLVVDGGKGQLGVAVAVCAELGIEGIPLAGMAKARTQSEFTAEEVDRTEERLFLPNRVNPIVLQPRRATTHLMQRLRDETHRFAITYHRQLRGKSGFVSILENIPGVGAGRKKQLLRRFGSLKRIKSASAQELHEIGGLSEALAARVYRYLNDPGKVT